MLAISRLLSWLSSLSREEEGQGLVEYGLVLILVSIVAFGALTLLGTTLSGMFTTIANVF